MSVNTAGVKTESRESSKQKTEVQQIHGQLTCDRWCRSFHTRLLLCQLHSHQNLYTVQSEREHFRTLSEMYLLMLVVIMSKITGILKRGSQKLEKTTLVGWIIMIKHIVSGMEMNGENPAFIDLTKEQSKCTSRCSHCTHTVHQHLAQLFGSYKALGQLQRVGGPENIHRAHHHLRRFTWRHTGPQILYSWRSRRSSQKLI